ncbi:type II secretion system minor pseudopilin GspJ [Pseudoalteromonas carrageenovora]|uniref:Type II secretion system protein J n=1 Tax=Pseudoalteromonas carrageenovora IAM 12662 TaxID=1314868 RepID=A0A2K4X5F0_PSEVC|nr:type II secretion system minor pseudopilin GspJ [Pseudoalteromonas carrageenovora]MBE0384076.1 general secretion pathway protein J [Pseudoalteromonas carrageenovora IAM 12662]MCQ8891680.1 type II secretion system minor pseudopilin GspJ [Pseudoalteromonas carrageenovora]MDO6466270.1 type II secretion system minor pseudopilin GspJ [Pseudoalteromonas carrageenovora]MDO6837709.1 type II secretion system minor pseudopilin GspJ [Pseudoalteromonas carrageenovora]QBJ70495.1 general secretion pathwa
MKQRGFTLLEVMVALGILAFVIIATHQILDSTTKAKDASDETIAELNALQTTFRLMDQDFSQMTKRAVRNESGDVQEQYLLAGRYVLESQYDGIAFVRDGWINPINLLPRSELQAVGYRVLDDNLERVYRVYVDQLDNMEPRVQRILENVEELKFEFLDDKNAWQEQWEIKALPKAVAVTLQQIEAEPIRRVFLVPGQGKVVAPPSTTQSTSVDNG